MLGGGPLGLLAENIDQQTKYRLYAEPSDELNVVRTGSILQDYNIIENYYINLLIARQSNQKSPPSANIDHD